MSTYECCEGGTMTAGCYHDHCTGPVKEDDDDKDED